MTDTTTKLRHFGSSTRLDLATFATLCEQRTVDADYPLAQRLARGVPIYAGQHALALSDSPDARLQLLDEWHHCLLEGPGVLVIEAMYADTSVVDAASDSFFAIIEAEKASGARGDHFAPSGSNDRIWSAFQKHALQSPDGFLAYYANPLLALVSETWLGPDYQVTSQVNVVNPGGQAQRPHRDYHLGFQDDDAVSRYPLSMQIASQLLTLQGAIAHSDMPVETGPTQLLPYSHHYPEGYMAYRDSAFQAYFDRHAIQLPLTKGDGVFFNPALFHAAGTNRSTDSRRMANLLQISSAFGRAMESVDTRRLIEVTYPTLYERYSRDGMTAEIQAFVTAVSEGYPFPANLDRTPPRYGMAPESQRQLLERALQYGWPLTQLRDALQQHDSVRHASPGHETE